jgi:glycosyltransferase involved in cell wall biosynthesis
MTQFCPIFIFAPGVLAGAERVVLTGISALFEEGMAPKIIIIKESRAPQYADEFIKLLNPNISYNVFVTTTPLDFSLRKKIKKIIEQESRSAVIHTHGFKALFYSYMVFSPHPLIHTHHGNTGHTLKVKVYEHLATKIMKKCRHVIAVSENMKNELLIMLKPYNRISTVENMLSLKNATEIRKKSNIFKKNNSIIQLVFIGRLSPEKGLMQFLHYFNSFNDKSKFQLDVLGDGPELEEIKNFIAKNNLKHLITLNGFVIDPTDFLIKSDLLVMPSLKEGLPMTLIEAVSVGLPVLANDVGAVGTLVKNNFNGILINHSSEASWHNAFALTLKNFDEWKVNAINQSDDIEVKYSSESWAKKTMKIYEKVL